MGGKMMATKTKNEIGASLFAKAAQDRQIEQQTIKAAIDNTGKEKPAAAKEQTPKAAPKAKAGTTAVKKANPATANAEPKKEVKKIIEEDGDVVMERLNLNIPSYIKKYLTVQAAQASIDQAKKISVTDYLCNLVKEDMKKKRN